MSEPREHLTAAELAIDSYLDELLQEPVEEAPGEIAAAVDEYCVFDVSGLLVAVPAARVHGEIARPRLRPQPGAMQWLRWASHGERERPLVDIALLVLPADLAPGSIPLAERCDRVLTLDDGSWWLALNGPTRTEVIDADAVCWRGPRGRRPWLAGTLADRRCVLLDTDNIRQLAQWAAGEPGACSESQAVGVPG